MPCHRLSDTKLILQHCHVKLLFFLLGGCHSLRPKRKWMVPPRKDDGKCHQKSAKIRHENHFRWPRKGAIQDARRKLAAAHRPWISTWISRDTDATKRQNDPQVVDRRQHFPRCQPSAIWLSCQLRRYTRVWPPPFCSPQGNSTSSHL